MKKTISLFMFVFILFAIKGNATTISYMNGTLEYPMATHEIYINGTEPFSAYLTSAHPTYGGISHYADTFFFLFDSNMHLVTWDDDSGSTPWSPKIYQESLESGRYHLYLTWPNVWPMNNEGMLADLPWALYPYLERPPLSDGPLEYWQPLTQWFHNGMYCAMDIDHTDLRPRDDGLKKPEPELYRKHFSLEQKATRIIFVLAMHPNNNRLQLSGNIFEFRFWFPVTSPEGQMGHSRMGKQIVEKGYSD